MPSVPITGSPDITSLDSKIVANLCLGNFEVDVTPSVFVSGRADDVQGASVRITNPVGVVIKNYPTSGFDIYPPMTGVSSTAIPLIANNFQYGTYTIDIRLTDSVGDFFIVTKTVNICPPDSKNKNKKEGCITASIKGDCVVGSLVMILDNLPTYKGVVSESQVNDLTIEYPTASELPPIETSLGSVGITLFEGQYKVSGSVCALYDYGDEVYFKVKYKVKAEKIIRCLVDECVVLERLAELNARVISDCSQADKDATSAIIINAMWLLNLAKMSENCGADPSDYITQLEALLGMSCTCTCNEGAPIGGNSGLNGVMYRGLLTQIGVNAPTAEISTINKVQITWEYLAVGSYKGVLTGSFTPLTEDNTFIVINQGYNALSSNMGFFIKAGYNSPNSIIVLTKDNSNAAANSLMFNVPLELSIL